MSLSEAAGEPATTAGPGEQARPVHGVAVAPHSPESPAASERIEDLLDRLRREELV